jgi:protein-S-isoprenylcysteine O-methyltransferase Ste14
MMFLRLYLLFGLVFHKFVWETLKQQSNEKPSEPKSLMLIAVKAVKISILLGIIVQTLLPTELFPITTNPLTLRIVGTAIYTIGLLTAISARIQLGNNWANIETGQVLQDQKVVAKGIYAYIRHPIYIGDLLLLLGLELALNSWLVLGVFLLAPVVLLQAVKEEGMLVRALPGYDTYCARTKRFIPFVI